jgi:hypothetical protein
VSPALRSSTAAGSQLSACLRIHGGGEWFFSISRITGCAPRSGKEQVRSQIGGYRCEVDQQGSALRRHCFMSDPGSDSLEADSYNDGGLGCAERQFRSFEELLTQPSMNRSSPTVPNEFLELRRPGRFHRVNTGSNSVGDATSFRTLQVIWNRKAMIHRHAAMRVAAWQICHEQRG